MTDSFASATVLSGATGSVGFSTVGTTLETGEPDGGWTYGTTSSDVLPGSDWYRWTCPSTGFWVFASSDPVADCIIEIYDGGSFANMRFLGYDDSGGAGGTDTVTFLGFAGRVYSIRLLAWQYAGEAASGTLTWRAATTTERDDAVAARDAHSDVTSLPSLNFDYGTTNPVVGVCNIGATSETDETFLDGTATNSVWVALTVYSGQATVRLTSHANFTGQIDVFQTGGPGVFNLTRIATGDLNADLYFAPPAFTGSFLMYVRVTGNAGQAGYAELQALPGLAPSGTTGLIVSSSDTVVEFSPGSFYVDIANGPPYVTVSIHIDDGPELLQVQLDATGSANSVSVPVNVDVGGHTLHVETI